METRARESEPGVFVVLGATGGVGSALTRRLAGQGHRVLAAGRSAERLEALASETGAKPFVLDARRTGEVLACLSAAMDHFGELDGVANCVGSARSGGAKGRPLSLGVVRAAGGVVVRDGAGRELLVVHRPRYRDWTFPKGKADPGESDEACAVREVEEETGLRCVLGSELSATEYVDARGRPKRVRYWLMQVESGELRFEHEVDDARWVTAREAEALLTYPRDLELVRAAAAA